MFRFKFSCFISRIPFNYFLVIPIVAISILLNDHIYCYDLLRIILSSDLEL